MGALDRGIPRHAPPPASASLYNRAPGGARRKAKDAEAPSSGLWLITDGATPRPELVAVLEGAAPSRRRSALLLQSLPGRSFPPRAYLSGRSLGNLMMRFFRPSRSPESEDDQRSAAAAQVLEFSDEPAPRALCVAGRLALAFIVGGDGCLRFVCQTARPWLPGLAALLRQAGAGGNHRQPCALAKALEGKWGHPVSRGHAGGVLILVLWSLQALGATPSAIVPGGRRAGERIGAWNRQPCCSSPPS